MRKLIDKIIGISLATITGCVLLFYIGLTIYGIYVILTSQ